jgi:hypothetical protein
MNETFGTDYPPMGFFDLNAGKILNVLLVCTTGTFIVVAIFIR